MPAKCPQCGTPLPVGALAGFCPACLLKAGVDDTVTEARQPAFQPPPISELAAKFPQLEILELIGKGGMGAVYKARQLQLDRLVALKILPPGIGDAPAFAERFAREAKALARLNHPGIVTIYDFGRTDGLFYFFMEYVDGVNLRQLLQAGRVSPREALAIVPQICDALQFAHDQGIVHRDIKPENILLDRRGRVKVADFGLAKIMGDSSGENAAAPARPADQTDLTEAGKVMGTPQYMAPEQREHPGDVDHRADIYAVGVVFYQMLTGELPGKQLQPPSAKVRIDVRLDEVVLRALEKQPELRYQQASVLKTQVETIAGTPPAGIPAATEQTVDGKPAAARSPFSPLVGLINMAFVFAGLLLMSSVYFGYPRESRVFHYFSMGFLSWIVIISGHLFFRARRLPDSRLVRWFLQVLAVFAGVTCLVAVLDGVFHSKTGKAPASNEADWPVIRREINKAVGEFPATSDLSSPETACAAWERFCARMDTKAINQMSLAPRNPNQYANWYVREQQRDAEGMGIYAKVRIMAVQTWHDDLANVIVHIPFPGDSRRVRYGNAYFGKTNNLWEYLTDDRQPTLSDAEKNFIGSKDFLRGIFTNALAGKQSWSPGAEEYSAAAETWQPTLAAGEKLDLSKVLDEIKGCLDRGEYEPALQRQIWYFNHAREFGESNPVRLSLGITHWNELARRHPKARQALAELRDHDLRESSRGGDNPDLSLELQSLNRLLADAGAVPAVGAKATYSSFDQPADHPDDQAMNGTINFENVDVNQVLKIYEAISKRTIVHGALPMAQINLRSAIPLTHIQTLQLLDTALAAQGIAMVVSGDTMIKAVPAGQVAAENPPEIALPWQTLPDSSSPMTRTVHLTNLSAETAVPMLQPLARLANSIILIKSHNDLILRDYASSIRQQLKLLETLDQPPASENASADALLTEQPPVVVETFPRAGAQDVPPGELEVRVRFSKPMENGSWSWSTAWENSTPESVGEPHYLADQRTCVMKVKLEPGKSYGWWLNSWKFTLFRDRARQPAVPYLLTFTTKTN